MPDGGAMIHLGVIGTHGLIGARHEGTIFGQNPNGDTGLAERGPDILDLAKGLRHAGNTADGHPICYSANMRGRAISARLS